MSPGSLRLHQITQNSGVENSTSNSPAGNLSSNPSVRSFWIPNPMDKAQAELFSPAVDVGRLLPSTPGTGMPRFHSACTGCDGCTGRDNGVLLCRHHHNTIHKTPWEVRMGGDGRPEFLPPPW